MEERTEGGGREVSKRKNERLDKEKGRGGGDMGRRKGRGETRKIKEQTKEEEKVIESR